mmetsp:Transcript_18087/g.20553  ORF Transcript_18087/g.20553 Transcript_18087/m.20553 type:complete len:112 (+) Transcript_18087:893-1228(+)
MKERGITGDVSRSIIRIWTGTKSTVEFSPNKRVFPRLSMISQINSGNNLNGSHFCETKCEKGERAVENVVSCFPKSGEIWKGKKNNLGSKNCTKSTSQQLKSITKESLWNS